MFVQECVRNFWNKYKLLVYPNKIPFGKWSAADINLKIGDVVQVLETDAANRSWKLATVEKIFEDSDKLVRKVEIAGCTIQWLYSSWLDVTALGQ